MSNFDPENNNVTEEENFVLDEMKEEKEAEQKNPFQEDRSDSIQPERSPFQPDYRQPYQNNGYGYQQGARQNDPYGNQPSYYQNYQSPYGQQGGFGYQPNYQPEQKQKRKLSAGGVIAIILAVALAFGILGFFASNILTARESSHTEQSQPSEKSERPDRTQKNEQPSAPEQKSSLFSEDVLEPMTISRSGGSDAILTIPEVVEKTADSVVEITTEYVATSYTMQQYITSGAGSGVIVTENGYIVTNNHVIDEASAITVTLRNGESYPATLVGLDEDLDIALLKIEASGLTTAVFGTSDSLVVGQTIIVIGNPLGQLGGSVSHGIISALDRAITIDGKSMQLLQIDAAVNPGNSGGALFDEAGNLVGIVNAKSSGEAVEGIGFAIPIDHVAEILDDLVDYGYVKGKAAMGITMVDITNAQTAWMYQVSELGTYVYSVNEGSAAAAAGLQAGDRIVSVGGVEVFTGEEVKAQLTGIAVGEEIEIVVSRNGQEQTLTVVMGEYIPEGIRGRVNGQ